MIPDNTNVVHIQVMTCLCVLTSIAQHKRSTTIRHLNTTSQGWLSIQSCSVCGLGEVEAQRTAHRPESLVGRNYDSPNLCHLEVLVRHPWPAEKIAKLPREVHAVKTDGNISTPVAHLEILEPPLILDSPPPDNSSTAGGGANRASAVWQSTTSRRRFSFFFHEEDAEHASGSKVEGSEPNLTTRRQTNSNDFWGFWN